MIRGVHALLYTSDAQATRDFIRDKLRLPHTDVGEGWLIFDLPEGDLGCHPVDASDSSAGTHEISFYCDDIEATVAQLRSRGVGFKGDVVDRGWGLVTEFTMPGGVEVQLYQPRYTKAKATKRAKPASRPRRAAKRAKSPRKAKAKGRPSRR
jgi:predicted enzyme related to lactoylglutathione lyase